ESPDSPGRFNVTRAREIASRMTKPAASVTATADLLEDAARRAR
ncbi:hypothetical protein, partial [Mycobacterium tuberculosis]